MSSDHKILEKIDLYAKGKMDEGERAEFEKELETNHHLRRQMELSMLVDQMVVVKEALKLKEQMKKDLYKPKTNWGLYLGAGLMVLSIAGGGLFWSAKTSENPTLPQPQNPSQTQMSSKKELAPSGTEKATPANEKTISPKKRVAVQEKTEKTLPPTVHEPDIVTVSHEKAAMPSVSQQTPVVVEQQKSEKARVVVAQADPCAGLQPNVEFTVVPSCKGETSGEVHVHPETVKGGTAPYHFVISGMESSSHFAHLSSGYYTLLIKDAHNCSVANKQTVFVPEKVCKEAKQQVFNPEYDQSWRIPYDTEKTPISVKILDKSGKLFYQTPVVGGTPDEWRGDSNTGLTLSLGLYFYTIEYTDKSVDEGSIMITR